MISRFSRAAKSYGDAAAVQRSIARRLADRVADRCAVPRRFYEVGCGTGFLTRALLERSLVSHIIACDQSPEMIACAREALGELGEAVEWRVGDGQLLPQGCEVDAVVSSGALHWLEDLGEFFEAVMRRSQTGGWSELSVALMLRGTLAELRGLRSKLFPSKLLQSELPTAWDVQAALSGAGFLVEEIELEEVSTLHPSAVSFFKSLGRTGVTGGRLSYSQGGRLGRAELRQLEGEYESRNAIGYDRAVVATYQIGYFRARL